MIVNANFRFLVNISLEGYKCKTDATACLSRAGSKAIGMNKMAFKEQWVTPAEFLNYATSGHAFCNIFKFDKDKYWIKTEKGCFECSPYYLRGANKGAMKINFKADEYFKGSYTVFVDIDNTSFDDIGEYIDSLVLKPTVVYASYSDNVAKHGIVSRRFRMVYVFSSMLGLEDFCNFSDAIHEHVKSCTNEPIDDYCGTRPSQYMNGVYGNNETYCTNIIYDTDDFEPIIYEPTAIIEEKDLTAIDDSLLIDIDGMCYEDFTHKHSWHFRYLYRSVKDDWQYSWKCNARYQLTDDDYLQLWVYREPVKDGEHRRRKLFKNACLRRLMFPDMDANELLYNLYIDAHRFFDNSDGVLTVDVLRRKVINAFKMSVEELKDYCKFEIQYWKTERPKFIVLREYGLDMQRAVNIIGAEIRYSELDKLYNSNLSVSDNFANGMGVSKSTLYRYCADRHIETSPRDTPTQAEIRLQNRNEKQKEIDLFVALYDPASSLRKMQRKLKDNGLHLSLTTISEWSRKYAHYKTNYHYWEVPEYSFTPQWEIPNITVGQTNNNECRPNWMNHLPVPNFNQGYYQ